MSPEKRRYIRKRTNLQERGQGNLCHQKKKKVQRKERKRKSQAESAEEAAKRKRKNRDSMVRNHQVESAKEAARRKQKDRGSKTKKRVEVNAIHRSIKEAKEFLHRTQDPKNPHRHRSIVCIICD